MATSVRIRYREYLRPGFDPNGNPSQRKQQVGGRLVVTAFNGGGESLTPSDLGLDTIDYISLSVEEGAGSKSGETRVATYSFSAQEFYIFQSASTGLTTTGTSARDYNVGFLALGNSLRAPQFL